MVTALLLLLVLVMETIMVTTFTRGLVIGHLSLGPIASEPQRCQRIDTRGPLSREIARCQTHENE
jgi:hypothetical protein